MERQASFQICGSSFDLCIFAQQMGSGSVRKSAVHRASVSLLIGLVSESGTDVKRTTSNEPNTPTTQRSMRDCLINGVVAANTDCTHAVCHNPYFFIVLPTDYSYHERSIVTAKFLLQH